MTQEVPVSSSVIRSVSYETDATLTVRFHAGTVYRYFTVPRPIVEAFLAAPSKGAYYHHHLRDRCPYRRLADALGSP
jgi:hypothetical protein